MTPIKVAFLSYCYDRPTLRRSYLVSRLAKHCGVTQRTFYRWLRGQTSPSPEALAHLSQCMNVPKSRLVP